MERAGPPPKTTHRSHAITALVQGAAARGCATSVVAEKTPMLASRADARMGGLVGDDQTITIWPGPESPGPRPNSRPYRPSAVCGGFRTRTVATNFRGPTSPALNP